jgi:hypothetical protein
MRTVYQVYWDNGAHACGVFPEIYATYEEADKAAAMIEANLIAEDVWDGTGSCEVVEAEVTDEDDEEEAAAAEEQSLDYFNRYVAGDR